MSYAVNQRGTAVWAFDRFRSDAIVQLLNDLTTHVDAGIDDSVCREIRAALAVAVNCATAIPDKSILRKSIWEHIQKLEDFYREWNDVSGSDRMAQNRRWELIRLMRNQRNSIATACRINRHVIESDLDLQLVTSIYDALKTAVHSGPATLLNLAEAVLRFEKRLPESK